MPRWQVRTIAVAVFSGILCLPFLAWILLAEGGSYSQREAVGWGFGLTMILWLPLTMWFAWWASALIHRSLSPRR